MRTTDITNKQLLKRLRKHMIDKKLSFYTFHDGMTRQGVEKRMAKDEKFKIEVLCLKAEHVALFEEMALDNMHNKEFNAGLFQHLTRNKRAFLPYEVLELEKRIQELEERQNG